jgi:hypothetical protein
VLPPDGQKVLNDLDRNPASKAQTTANKGHRHSFSHHRHIAALVEFQESQQSHNNEERNLVNDIELRSNWIVLRFSVAPSEMGGEVNESGHHDCLHTHPTFSSPY